MAGQRLRLIGPGLLVAATGVGAGDLATAAFTGSQIGVAVLWAVLLGAALKFVLNEGLARYQLATGQTLLEGACTHGGRWVGWVFLPYLLLWSWFVGSALVSACGVTAHALFGGFADVEVGKRWFGIAASALGVVLVELGGYRVFERLMRLCIGVMFVIVVATAVLVAPDWPAVMRGLFLPTVPDAQGEGLSWTVALIGGVGGTLTVLCYGYWMREEQRDGADGLTACRIDLGVGYGVTAVFGVAMVIIGSTVEVGGGGASLLVALADRLVEPLGEVGRVAFLIGAFGAVFSSLLGVWQSVPYLFADYLGVRRGGAAVDPRGAAYRGYLYGLATLPLVGLWFPFRSMQKAYAVFGAAFLPLLALTLLWLNRRRFVGPEFANGHASALALGAALAFFLAVGTGVWLGWAG